jgi:hypothetical protein
LAKPVYRCVNAVLELHDRVVRPKALPEVFAENHLMGTLQEGNQDAEWLFRESYVLSFGIAEFGAAKVELKSFEANHAFGLANPHDYVPRVW